MHTSTARSISVLPSAHRVVLVTFYVLTWTATSSNSTLIIGVEQQLKKKRGWGGESSLLECVHTFSSSKNIETMYSKRENQKIYTAMFMKCTLPLSPYVHVQ